MDPLLAVAIVGLLVQVGGALFGNSSARRQNERQQEALQDKIAYLEDWYDQQQTIYDNNQERALEGAEQATEHVTESATAKMGDLREDRDLNLYSTQERTEIAADNLLAQSVQSAAATGQATSDAGFSGLANTGSLERTIGQTEMMGDWAVEQGAAQMDLQRDLGFQQSYGLERGAVRTGEEMNRQIQSIDLQLNHNQEQMTEQFDLLSSQYEFDRGYAQRQLSWLQEDRTNLGWELGFEVLNAGVNFMTFAYEYELFER